MSAYWSSVESPQAYVKPVKRPRGPQALTFLFTFLQPATFAFLSAIPERPMHAETRKHPPCPLDTTAPVPVSSSPPQQLENIFIDALAQACLCRRHLRVAQDRTILSKPTYLYHRPRRRYQDSGRQVRHLHRNAAPTRSPSSRAPLSREEYMSMLDWYREPFSTQATCIDSEPFRPQLDWPVSWSSDRIPSIASPASGVERQPSVPLSPSLPSEDLLSSNPSRLPEQSESSKPLDPPSPDELADSQRLFEPSTISEGLQSTHIELRTVTSLYEVLNKEDCTHEAAFNAYSVLPRPGVSHLSEDGIRLLFRRLSTLEKKDQDSMLRYLSVIDDMKSINLHMTEAEWNSAIAFCGQCFARIKAADVETALRTWKEMEEVAAVKSGKVTFNILFDMAAKAGKFVLAEMILKEMEARGLPFNRYGRVGLIYYHGLRADGDAVRRAYRELVEAGEIVDTVVMNCVIASLIRAGEPTAAERVYERMKRRVAKHTGQRVLSLCWREERSLGRVLDRAARKFRYQPVKLQQIRNEQLLAPNLHTYAIFVEHHASQTGELRRIVALLTEMQYLGIPMHGRIFLKIFKGFCFHGGQRYTTWTKARLESVWNALLTALDEEPDFKIMKWMVIWTVRAFERCAGKERTLEVWEELRRRWKPHDWSETEAVMGILRDVLAI